MKIKKLLKKVGKNSLIALSGAVIGSIISFLYLFYIWLPNNSSEIGLGVIGLIPVLLIFSVIIGSIIGGLGALIIKWLIKKLKK